jgi:hypothetical protein
MVGNMARINVEDSIWSDHRFDELRDIASQELSIKSGHTKAVAIGSLIVGWQVAQKYYPNKIPIEVWDRLLLSEAIVRAGLAVRCDDGIAVRGVDDAFSWLLAARHNGRKGGRPQDKKVLPSENRELQKPKHNPDEPSTNPDEPSRNPLTLTLTLAPTLAPTLDPNTRGVADAVCAEPKPAPRPRQKKQKPDAQESSNDVTLVWEAFVDSMQRGFNTTPPRNAKTKSQCKALIAAVGFESAKKLAAYYPTRRKPYYVQRGFPFGLLLTDYNALLLEISGGQKLTSGVIKAIENQEIAENACASPQLALDVFSMEPEEFHAYCEKMNALEETKQLMEASDENDAPGF